MHSEGRYGVERGLVGWWRLKNSNEGVNDIIGTNNGTLNGGMTYGSSGGRECAIFDGGNDNVGSIGASTAWSWMHGKDDPVAFKWTIAFFIFRNNFSAPVVPFGNSNSDATHRGVTVYLDTSRTLYYSICRAVAAQPVINGSTAVVYPNDTNWHHIAITHDQSLASANGKFYLDGAYVGSLNKNVHAPSTGDASYDLRIGSGTSSGGAASLFVNGGMNQVRVYNRVLSAAEIARLARIY